jgi:hypothetical protein
LDAGDEEGGEAVPVAGAAVGLGGDDAGRLAAGGGEDVEQKAGRDFVADLDHVRRGAGGLELGDGVAGVIVDGFDQRGEGQVAPGGGLGLLAGIGPVVAVVEINEQAEAGGFDALGHRHGAGQAAVTFGRIAARGGGVHEEPQADVVEAVGF